MGSLKDTFWENVIEKVNDQGDEYSIKLISKIKAIYDNKGISGVKELFEELDNSINIGRELNEN